MSWLEIRPSSTQPSDHSDCNTPDSPTTIIFIFILGVYFPAMSMRTSMHTLYQWIRKNVEGSGRGLTWGIIVTYMAGLRKPPKTLVLLSAATSTQDLINVKRKSTHWEVTVGQTANLHQTCTLENKSLDVIKMHRNVSGYSEYLTKHSVWKNIVYVSEQRYTQSTSRLYVMSVCVILNDFVKRNQWKWTACYWKLHFHAHGLKVRALAWITGRGAPRDSITGARL